MKPVENYQNIAQPFLKEICDVANGTSTWLSKHDFKRRVSTVVAEYVSEQGNATEKMGDIGEEYPEAIESNVWKWLHSNDPQPFTLQVEDIPPEKLEHYEYLEDDVQSVLCLAVHAGKSIWGFVEIWDTRAKHIWTTDEITLANNIVPRLEAALQTSDTSTAD